MHLRINCLAAVGILLTAVLFTAPTVRAADSNTVQATSDDNNISAANLPKPTPQQDAWQDAELGMFFHFDIEVFDKHYEYNHARNRSTGAAATQTAQSTTRPADDGPKL
ncbi:MAG TPA: hypothetical protein VKJ65_02275, partial [Phycisphaerae bacterium]|nr:hypothetical protein [Phycisphaerae bacterium]